MGQRRSGPSSGTSRTSILCKGHTASAPLSTQSRWAKKLQQKEYSMCLVGLPLAASFAHCRSCDTRGVSIIRRDFVSGTGTRRAALRAIRRCGMTQNTRKCVLRKRRTPKKELEPKKANRSQIKRQRTNLTTDYICWSWNRNELCKSRVVSHTKSVQGIQLVKQKGCSW